MSDGFARRIKRMVSSGLARTARRPRLTPGQLLELRPRRILIVRQHNQMGDMVCATPALRAIRETWPDAETALITAPINRGVVENNPDLDHIYTFERRFWRNPFALAAFVRRLRRYRPELAFVLSSISFSVTSAWLAAASGARHLVGADSRPFGWDVSRHLFSLEMIARPEMDCPAVAHNLAPLQALGIATSNTTPVVVPSAEHRAAAAGIMEGLSLSPGFWALHPGAGKEQNIWPAGGFAEMARRARRAGKQVLVLHGPADAEALAALAEALSTEPVPEIHVAPPCPLGVGAALLQSAERFLCNDTGIMHVAGALRVPTVALFGPTDPDLWRPPVPEVVALKSSHRSDVPPRAGFGGDEFGWMENISPEDVWTAWSGLPRRVAPAKVE